MNKAKSITKLHNFQIKIKKSFTTFHAKIEDMDNEEYSNDYEEEKRCIFSMMKQTGSKGCTKPQ